MSPAVDGLEGVEWRVVSEELPGRLWLWTASDPHPVDELSNPEHCHPYISAVQVAPLSEQSIWWKKGWTCLALVSAAALSAAPSH